MKSEPGGESGFPNSRSGPRPISGKPGIGTRGWSLRLKDRQQGFPAGDPPCSSRIACMSRQDANAAFASTSFLYGGNASYVDDLYARYEADQNAVDAEWQAFFQSLKDGP